jgi:LysR family transcriptional regulator for metE and metH
MILELRHLKLVEAIAGEGTVTGAGRRLHLTQSALSHQLRDVEERLGAPLFHRISKKMILTPAGERLLRSARLVLQEVERTEEEVSRIGRQCEGVLRIATQCYTGYHWLPAVLKEFQARRPAVGVRIVVEATARPLEALLEGSIDLAICNSRVRDRRLAVKSLFDDEYLALVAPDHVLATRKFVRPSDFTEENLLVYSTLEETRFYQSLLAPAGLRPKSVSQVQLTEAMIEMVSAGLGIAVLARWAVQPHLASGSVRGLPLTRRGLRQEWRAVTLRSQTTPLYVREFIERLSRFRPAADRTEPPRRRRRTPGGDGA